LKNHIQIRFKYNILPSLNQNAAQSGASKLDYAQKKEVKFALNFPVMSKIMFRVRTTFQESGDSSLFEIVSTWQQFLTAIASFSVHENIQKH